MSRGCPFATATMPLTGGKQRHDDDDNDDEDDDEDDDDCNVMQ